MVQPAPPSATVRRQQRLQSNVPTEPQWRLHRFATRALIRVINLEFVFDFSINSSLCAPANCCWLPVKPIDVWLLTICFAGHLFFLFLQ
jgi:hypothetical protein